MPHTSAEGDLSKQETFQMVQGKQVVHNKGSCHALCFELHCQEVIDSSLQVLWLGTSNVREFRPSRNVIPAK